MIVLDASVVVKWFLLALANDLDCRLVTADQRIVQQAEPFASVKLLS